jgi:SAM-dependent methyltransferase
MRNDETESSLRSRFENIGKASASLMPERLQAWWLKYLESHLDHYLSVLSLLSGPKNCGPLLEVGCMPGHLSIMLAKLGYDWHGVDLNPARGEKLWAAHSLGVAKTDIEIERLPFENGSFSIVLFTEVLEHLRINPLFALREIARVMKPGGRIILSVPNITPVHRLKFLLGRDYQGDIIEEFEKLDRYGHMGHIRLYSKREIIKILHHIGCSGIKHEYGGSLNRKKPWLRRLPFHKYFRSNLYFVASCS